MGKESRQADALCWKLSKGVEKQALKIKSYFHYLSRAPPEQDDPGPVDEEDEVAASIVQDRPVPEDEA
jgi:hypothetical protein